MDASEGAAHRHCLHDRGEPEERCCLCEKRPCPQQLLAKQLKLIWGPGSPFELQHDEEIVDPVAGGPFGLWRPDFRLSMNCVNVLVEVDGYRYHHQKYEFERDRVKARHYLLGLNYPTMSFTANEVSGNVVNPLKSIIQFFWNRLRQYPDSRFFVGSHAITTKEFFHWHKPSAADQPWHEDGPRLVHMCLDQEMPPEMYFYTRLMTRLRFIEQTRVTREIATFLARLMDDWRKAFAAPPPPGKISLDEYFERRKARELESSVFPNDGGTIH